MSTPFRPTLVELPDELVGPRVLLRPYRPADADQVFAAIDESREHLKPWMPWVDNHGSIDDTRDFCIQSASHWLLRSELPLAMFERATGRYLGSTGFHAPDWELRAFETGYWLRATAVGNGFMTEAMRLLAALAFTDLQARRLALQCEAHNEASRRVAERAGFILEGRLRHGALATNGDAVDLLLYALTPDDWSQAQASFAAETSS
jgi:ribosomal-protein-serine acetyltransferase